MERLRWVAEEEAEERRQSEAMVGEVEEEKM